MKKIAFLSIEDLTDFVCYDELLVEPFANKGYEVDRIDWRENKDWSSYEAVIVRSTWDYQDDSKRFFDVLAAIDNSSARLENSLDIMKWNVDKRYLQELIKKGVPVIPSIFEEKYSWSQVSDSFQKFGCNEIVIKPCISANADDTFRLDKVKLQTERENLEATFQSKPHMIQPFLKAIVEEGEYSLFYFGGNFSHGILKTPKSGDFRVQEEHGGTLQKITPPEEMMRIGQQVIDALPEVPLYARVDLVSFKESYYLMEVELIEPSLYFNLDKNSRAMFVEEFLKKKDVF